MGWNGSGGAGYAAAASRRRASTVSNNGKGSKGGFYGVLALAVLALIGLTAVFVWPANDGKTEPESQKKPKFIKEVQPAPVKKIVEKDPREAPEFDGLDKSRIHKAINGEYVYLPPRGEERWPGERVRALALIGGTNRSVVIDATFHEDPEHPLMFHNELQSDMVQFARPGEFAVPINPNISDDVAWEAINAPIEFHKNDSDRQIEEKQYVIDMLASLKDYMEKGGHARDFFADYQRRQDLEAELNSQTREEVQLMINSGDLDAARDALEAYNKYRASKDLPPMRFRKLNGPTSNEQ